MTSCDVEIDSDRDSRGTGLGFKTKHSVPIAIGEVN